MTDIPLARIHGVDDLRLDTVPPPVCGPGDLIVQVRQCGICGSDLGYLARGGVMGPGEPLAIGHELWGLVSEIGDRIAHVSVGDRVVVQPMAAQNLIGNGGPEGGFSPYMLVRNAADDPNSTLKLPAGVPEQYGALVEPMAVALHGANRVATSPEDKVVIFGAGPIGLSLLLILRYRGLKDIIVVDLSARRLELAEALGAHALRGDDPALQAQLIDIHGTASFFGMPMPGSTIYFEMTGVLSVFDTILQLAGPGSRVCLTGVHKQPATVDLSMLLAREMSIVAAMSYDQEFDEVMAMLSSGQIDPTVMVTHHYPLSDIQAAFYTASDAEQAVKVVIDCQA